MADDGERKSEHSTATGQGSSSDAQVSQTTPSPSPSTSTAEDRSALLDRARAFLTSPNVVHEEPVTKRRFLSEKGLNEGEIDGLMRELPAQLPAVPPRTYPQLPPSNLPHLLLGLTKIFTWLTGGSAVLILLYYRFLLPRLTRSALARRSLKQYQVSLLARLNASLADLKTTQAETFAVLPSPPASREPPGLADAHSLDNLDLPHDAAISFPELTLLRCAIESLAMEGKKATKEELFALLDERYPWLKSDEGVDYQNSLWETLTNDACFSEVSEDGRLVWTYTAPAPPPPTALETSLTSLKSTFPPPAPRSQPSPYQRTLDVLADFTGYITTQTYQLASGTMRVRGLAGLGSAVPLSPQQEELKKEIRALKGLVLNRRTFAPAAVRSAAQTP